MKVEVHEHTAIGVNVTLKLGTAVFNMDYRT